MTYTYEWVVTAGDTDYSGLIYTPAVIECICRGLQGLMNDAGIPLSSAFVDEGVLPPVVHVEADYLDHIEVNTHVDVVYTPVIGETSITYNAAGYRGDEQVFDGEIVVAFTDAETYDPVPVPDWVRDALAPYTTGSSAAQTEE